MKSRSLHIEMVCENDFVIKYKTKRLRGDLGKPQPKCGAFIMLRIGNLIMCHGIVLFGLIHRESYMSAHVLLNLLNELGEKDKMRGFGLSFLMHMASLHSKTRRHKIIMVI